MKKLYIILAIILAIALLLVGFKPKDKPFIIIEHTAQSGDTLDSIYYQYGVNTMLMLKWRDEVKRLNGKDTSGLDIGEVVKIYVEVSE